MSRLFLTNRGLLLVFFFFFLSSPKTASRVERAKLWPFRRLLCCCLLTLHTFLKLSHPSIQYPTTRPSLSWLSSHQRIPEQKQILRLIASPHCAANVGTVRAKFDLPVSQPQAYIATRLLYPLIRRSSRPPRVSCV